MSLLRRDIVQLAPPECGASSALLLIILSLSLASAQGHSPLAAPDIVSTVPRTLHSHRMPVLDGNDIRFSRLSSAQGLSQTRVAQIVQDDQGFMWFATQYGLDRYDGYEFRVFTHDPTRADSLSCVYIHSLFKDSSGALWIGCDQFLDRFDPVTEIFSHYRIEDETRSGVANFVTEISQDRTGMLWLATGSGLFGLNPNSGRIIHYAHDPSNRSSLGNNRVQCTLEDRSGRLWIADGENLEEFDRDSGRVRSRVHVNGGVTALYEDRLGVLWVTYITSGTGSGLAILDRSTNQLIPYSLYDTHSSKEIKPGFMAAAEDKTGNLWLASFGDGLLKFDRKRGMFVRYRNNPENPESIADDRVISLCEDREGSIWLGLHAREPNFFRYERAPFTPLHFGGRTDTHSFGEAFVNAIYEDQEGILWTATTGAINRLHRKSGESASYSPPGRGESNDVITIAEDHAGDLWLGSYGSGLSRLDRRTGQYRTYLHSPANPSSLSNDIVSRLLVDHKGAIWIATYNGLDRFDPPSGRFVTYKQDPETDSEEYFNLAEDKSGVLWLGSFGGVNRFDPKSGKFTIYAHRTGDPTSLSDNTVTSVFVDHSGTLWVSTQNGLNKFDRASGTFSHYSVNDGLPTNSVSCILEDQFGRLWMSTNRGISRFDPVAKRFANYSTVDGLPGNDFTGWDACFKSSSGEMFFGGFSGAVSFFPERVINSQYPLPLVLTDFQLAGKSMSAGSHSPLNKAIGYATDVTLSHNQNVFSLNFAALTYFNPEANRYRYKLDGVDTDWVEVASDRRMASYTTLPPGTYRFHVQSATRQSDWNSPGLTLKISILPPWWSTLWFRFLCGLAAICLLWSLYQLRLQQVAAEVRARTEERLGERERIARELHDTLLQSIQGLILRFHAAAERIPPSEPVRQMVENALDRADEVLVEGRDHVKALRLTSEPMKPLREAFTDVFKDLLRTDGVEFSVVVEGAVRPLNPLIQDEAYWIGREAIVNALNHARASRIEVEIAYDVALLRLRFRDDGCGIDPMIIESGGKPGHWGMRGMRERAMNIGARLATWSRPGAGTEWELEIPGFTAYRIQGNGSRWLKLRRLWRKENRHEHDQSSHG